MAVSPADIPALMNDTFTDRVLWAANAVNAWSLLADQDPTEWLSGTAVHMALAGTIDVDTSVLDGETDNAPLSFSNTRATINGYPYGHFLPFQKLALKEEYAKGSTLSQIAMALGIHAASKYDLLHSVPALDGANIYYGNGAANAPVIPVAGAGGSIKGADFLRYGVTLADQIPYQNGLLRAFLSQVLIADLLADIGDARHFEALAEESTSKASMGVYRGFEIVKVSRKTTEQFTADTGHGHDVHNAVFCAPGFVEPIQRAALMFEGPLEAKTNNEMGQTMIARYSMDVGFGRAIEANGVRGVYRSEHSATA